jgi:hypothetical protein
MIMDKAIKELASREYNELCSLVSNITYFEAYNKLNGYNLTSEPITIGKENKLIGMNEFFDVKYKHIRTTIFRVKDNRCEVWEEFFLEFKMCATFDNDVDEQ